MDMIKIGQFLAQLRRENNLTQEELGEELGVTNKTVSRWETGTYLPPVEMLQLLSNKYGITINEMLAGERLNSEDFKSKAEENLTVALNNSVFTLEDKRKCFATKWLKDHRWELIIAVVLLVAATVLCAVFCKLATPICAIVCIVWYFWFNNRRQAYIERHLYGDTEHKE